MNTTLLVNPSSRSSRSVRLSQLAIILVSGLASGCGMVRQRGAANDAILQMYRSDARTMIFMRAPVVPNPSKQIARKESAGWTIASHDASGVCFEGKYTSIGHPVSKARLLGSVSVWDDAYQAEETVPRKDLEIVSFQPAPPEPAMCEAKQQRVVVDSEGRAIGAIEEPVHVPCTRYSADVRTCAPRLSLADASGKYVALTLGDVSAAWHLQ